MVAAALERSSDVWLGPAEVRRLLAAWGIPFVAERDAGSAEAAVEAARELGYPVAVKTAAPGVHKTETGGVVLGLTSDQEVRDAVARVGAPAVVQPLLSGNAELLAGLVQDPVFGPLVGFGPGGRLAELIAEAQFAIAPLTDVDAEELVRGGKAGRLVEGFRGAPPSDAGALAELALRLSRLGEQPARGGRARPQPRARARAGMRSRRCAGPCGRRGRAVADEDLVTRLCGVVPSTHPGWHRCGRSATRRD